MLALQKGAGLPLLEWGYPVLVATLVQAVLASVVLILLPLVVGGRPSQRANGAGGASLSGVAIYFGAIGLAFMFVEIAFIQRFVLFLSHPLYAVAVVLCAFLVFAGLGSRYSRRLQQREDKFPASPVALPVAAIGVVALGYLALLPVVFKALAPLSDALRIVATLGLIAPLAFAMGMPFPLGLARLAGTAPALIPWAWGINACASVVAAILATLLAIHLGFGAVVALAVLLYVIAWAVDR
jgi:hypothetical protein